MAGQQHVKKLEKSPYHLLKRAAQNAANIYMADVGRRGLTQRQFTVLTAVEANEGISQTELVNTTGIDRSTLADMISRLAAQGYLQRKRCKNDARTNKIRLMAAGRRALASVQPGAADVDKQILAAIPAPKRKEFVEMLSLLAADCNGVNASTARGAKTAKSARRSMNGDRKR
ncbi:MAG: MarR family winged helix-turn-helix transcriptional regulator [Hyphomicrobiales bacterium]|nr:MarR family winged helix-turn-helix transcriptional regulator [Hyphomicrobiales bacterium]